MIKRLALVLISVVTCISFSLQVLANDNIDSLSSARFEFATEFLTKFYRYAYVCEASDFDDYISSDSFLTYINEYANGEYTKRVINNSASKGLNIEYELLETDYLEGCVKFELVSKLYFTYETFGNKNAAEHGTMWIGSEIIVSGTENFEILDWYCEFSDATIRSKSASPDFWENKADADEVLTSLKQRTEDFILFRAQVEERVTAETAKDPKISSHESIQPRVIWPLNKSAMVTWATNNALSSSLVSSNPNIIPTYYDFFNY